MLTRKEWIFIFLIWNVSCSQVQNKNNSDWWIECKPVADSIKEISSSNRYNSKSLQLIYSKHQAYPKCRDGFYGEGISEVTVKSVASDFNLSLQIISSNMKMGDFVLNSINSSVDWHDLDRLAEKSKSSCSADLQSFCQKVHLRASNASQEAKKALDGRSK